MPSKRHLALFTLLAGATAFGQARITALDGEAVRVASGAETPLKVGDAVAAGEEIRVRPEGRLEATLGDGSVVRLGGGSQLRIDDASFDESKKSLSFRARLAAGKAWSTVVKLVGGGRYEVETDNGVAGVRGTEFVVTASEGTSTVEVLKGRVFYATQVQGAETGGVFVTKGQRVQVSAGGVSRGSLSGEDDFARWVRSRQRDRPDRESLRDRRRERLGQIRERMKEDHIKHK